MAAFTAYDPATDDPERLVDAIFTPREGVSLVAGSVVVRTGDPSGEPSTISFFDGSITQLNIGAGLLLTSGDPTPPITNTGSGYGQDAGSGAVDGDDADLQQTVDQAFDGAGSVNDVTYLQFRLNVTDPDVTVLRFEVVFGSDEFPEFSGSSFVDVAGVYVNGVNYALFEGDPLKPLSVVDANLTGGSTGAGYFRTNNGLPIEYDGISVKLIITVPLAQGDNVVKIAVADTGDSILDSGIFVSSMDAANFGTIGISQAVFVPDTGLLDAPTNQTYQGGDSGTTITFSEAGGGNDVYDGGGGVDTAEFEMGLGDVTFTKNEEFGTMLVEYGEGNSVTLLNVERLSFTEDDLYMAFDTNPGDTVYEVHALLNAWFDGLPNVSVISEWVARASVLAKRELGMIELADEIIGTYSDSEFLDGVVAHLYANIVGVQPDPALVTALVGLVGHDKMFKSGGDLFLYGAHLAANTNEIASIVGSVVVLDQTYF